MTRSQYSFSDHPLLSNPHNCVHHLEELFAVGQASKIGALPSPRLLNTHMAYSVLPDSIRESNCEIIYVYRDPTDRVVSAWHFTSSWHHSKKTTWEMMPTTESLSFATAFEMFCHGNSPWGPDWDHVLEYWRESLRRPENVLFLKYEEVMEEPVANAKRLAEFMGRPFSLEEEKDEVVEEIIRLCCFDKLSKLEVNKSGDQEGEGGGLEQSFEPGDGPEIGRCHGRNASGIRSDPRWCQPPNHHHQVHHHHHMRKGRLLIVHKKNCFGWKLVYKCSAGKSVWMGIELIVINMKLVMFLPGFFTPGCVLISFS